MNFPRKVFGLTLIIFSILGLLVSVFALVQVWRLRMPIATRIYDGLLFAEKIVNTTSSGLDVIDSSLTNVKQSMTALEESTKNMAQSVEDTSKLIGSFTDLFKGDLKQTLENTKISVVAAQSSALIIDNLLYGLSRIPILGIDYDPPKPLNTALSEIGDTLKNMPDSMDDISGTLSSSNDNLLSLKTGIDEIVIRFAEFQSDLSAAQTVINDYQANMLDIKISLDRALDKIFNWSIWVAVVLTIAIILIGVTQVTGILQGYEMMHYQQNLEKLIEKKILELQALKEHSSFNKPDIPSL